MTQPNQDCLPFPSFSLWRTPNSIMELYELMFSTRLGRCLKAAAFLLASTIATSAGELPSGTPARKPGFWQSTLTGSLGGQLTNVEKVNRICLDAHADRALYEKDIQEKRMSAVMLEGDCEEPDYSLSGNVLSGSLSCTNKPLEQGTPAGTEFRWTITYENDSQVTIEERRTDVNNFTPGEAHTVNRWIRVGDCEDGFMPGDSIEIRNTSNGHAMPVYDKKQNLFTGMEAGKKLMNDLKRLYQRVPE
ncbi:MAG: DUF3617 domain-containing protein [Phyllobacterium sp.]